MIGNAQTNDNNLRSKLNYIKNKISIKWSEVFFTDFIVTKLSSLTHNKDFHEQSVESNIITVSYSTSSLNLFKGELHDNLLHSISEVQQELCAQSKNLKSTVKYLLSQYENVLLAISQSNLNKSINLLEKTKIDCELLMGELEILQFNKETVELSSVCHISKSIKTVENIIENSNDILVHLNRLNDRQIGLENIEKERFLNFDDLLVQKKLFRISEHLNIPEKYENMLEIKRKNLLFSIASVEKLLRFTSNCFYVFEKKDYWNKLLKDIKFTEFSVNNITLKELYEEMKSKESNIEEVLSTLVDTIHSEQCISDQIYQIKTKWCSKAYQLKRLQVDKTLIISNFDDISKECLEASNKLKTLHLSPNVNKYISTISELEDISKKIFSFSYNLRECQQSIIQYKEMFRSGNKEIQRYLPNECLIFDQLFCTFESVLIKIEQNPKIVEVIEIPSLLCTVKELRKQFTTIQSAISKYLECQRITYGRFFFLGDNELIELLGCTPEIIQKHIRKIFPSIKSVNVTDKGDSFSIHSVETIDNEPFKFQKPLNILKLDITDVFKKIEKNLQKTLYEDIKENVKHFLDHGLQMLLHLSTETLQWIENQFSQCILVLSQILWTKVVEVSISSSGLQQTLDIYSKILTNLLNNYLHGDTIPILRSKIKMLIYEVYHQRFVVTDLIAKKVRSLNNPRWRENLRCYFIDEKIIMKIGFLELYYRYEIYGISGFDSIIRTPLVDSSFLSITDAARLHLGSLLYGPAGTGKTESVKQLAKYLGRLILVYNCGESFAEESIQRILKGASNLGAWVCFDEFNRLSHQQMQSSLDFIENIQGKLRSKSNNKWPIFAETLFNEDIFVHEDTLILLTMNKGYKGRTQLPSQVHNLFRSFSNAEPDLEHITRVLLHIQGFKYYTSITTKIFSFLKYCFTQMIQNDGYDFGIRTLKAVILSGGRILKYNYCEKNLITENTEESYIVKAIEINIKPRLLSCDVIMAEKFIKEIFPKNTNLTSNNDDETFLTTLNEMYTSFSPYFKEKIVQLKTLLQSYKSVIINGPSGCGKTVIWQSLIKILNQNDSLNKTAYFTINPNILDQGTFYGTFDQCTGEWKDGLLPKIFRSFTSQLKITDSSKDLKPFSALVVFDGSVSQGWIESLNSLFDDNASLTLSNGERLRLPENMKIIIETDNLKNANPSTISRCGLLNVEDVYDDDHTFLFYLIEQIPNVLRDQLVNISISKGKFTEEVVEKICFYLKDNEFLQNILLFSGQMKSHIMKYQRSGDMMFILEYLRNNFLEIIQNCKNNQTNVDIIIKRYLVQCLIVAVGSDCNDIELEQLFMRLNIAFPDALPKGKEESNSSLKEFWLNKNAVWEKFQLKSEKVSNEEYFLFNQMNSTKIIIKTKDTLKIEKYLEYSIKIKIPVIFCGHPGSGKSMTIMQYFEKLPLTSFVTFNFNCDTTPGSILELFDAYCHYDLIPTTSSKFGVSSLKMIPKEKNSTQTVFFFDEINLQKLDEEGNQGTSLLLRDIFEKRKFYHNVKHNEIVISENIFFIGACNPPNLGNRINLSNRLIRQSLIVFVDHPTDETLRKIYGKILEKGLKNIAVASTINFERLTSDSVIIFTSLRKYFSKRKYIHYLCTLRDFSRWIFTFLARINNKSNNANDFLKVWAVLGLHIFGDRLVDSEDHSFLQKTFGNVLEKWEKNLSEIPKNDYYLFRIDFNPDGNSHWDIFDLENLKLRISKKLERFSEDKFILTDQRLDQFLKLLTCVESKRGSNNVIILGREGSGREYMCDLLALYTNSHIIRIQPSPIYDISDFSEDLKKGVKLAIFENRKVIILIKCTSSTVADTIEKASPFLAQSNVENLFNEEEYNNLVEKMRSLNSHKMIKDSDRLSVILQEKMKFIIIINSEIVNEGNQIINSPAFFNRCHLIWFREWTNESFHQVASACLIQVQIQLNKNKNWEGSSAFNQFSQILEKVELMLISCHKFAVENLTKDNYNNMTINIRTPFTDIHFIRFLKVFEEVLVITLNEMIDRNKRLKDGCKVLQETMTETTKLEQSFKKKKENIESLENDLLEKLRVINNHRATAQKNEIRHQESHEQLQNLENSLFQKRKELDEKIKKQESELVEAETYLRNLQRKQIFEIKSMKHPPNAVKLACEAVCDILNENPKSWKDVLGVILKDNFVTRIVNFSWKNITNDKRQELIRKYLMNPDYTVENVSKASLTMGVVVKWTIAQLKYIQTLDKISPLKMDWERLQEENNAKRILISKCQLNLQHIRKSIEIDENENCDLKKKIASFQNEMKTIKVKLAMANKLTNIFREQYSTWAAAMDYQKENDKLIILDIILVSTIFCYTGHLNSHQKDAVLKDLYEKNQIAAPKPGQHKSVFQLLSGLKIDVKNPIQKIFDSYKTNILTFQNSKCSPLINDSSNKSLEVLKSSGLISSKFVETSFRDENFYNILKNVIQSECTLLIKDVEFFNPIISPIIRKCNEETIFINIKGENIRVSPKFKIILFSKIEKWDVPVEISANVSVISFCDDFKELEQSLVNHLLKKQHPEMSLLNFPFSLEENAFVDSQIHNQENKLLEFLIKNKDNLLNNQDLIKKIYDLNLTLANIMEKRKKENKTIEIIEGVVSLYKQVLRTLERLYTLLIQMEEWSPAYTFPISKTKKFIIKFMEKFKDKPIDDVKELSNSLLQEFFIYISRLIRHSDYVRFALSLCYIKQETVGEDSDFMEEQLWKILKQCLQNKNENLTDYDLKIKLITKYFSQFNFDISIFIMDVFKTWSMSSFSETDYHTISSFLPQFKEIDQLIFLTILASFFQPLNLEKHLKNLIYSALKIDIQKVSQNSSVEYLKKCLLRNPSELEPILMFISHQINPIVILNSIKASDCEICRLSTSLKRVDNFMEIFEGLKKKLCWFVVTNTEAAPLKGIKTKEDEDMQSKSLEKNIELFQKIYKNHKNYKFIFVTDINSYMSKAFVKKSRSIILEREEGFKSCMEHNLILFSQINTSKNNAKGIIYFLLLVFHSLVQRKSEEMANILKNDYNFNDVDFLCAVNVAKTSFKLEMNEIVVNKECNYDLNIKESPSESMFSSSYSKFQPYLGDVSDMNNLEKNTKCLRKQLKSLIMKSVYGGRVNKVEDLRIFCDIFDKIFGMNREKISNKTWLYKEVLKIPNSFEINFLKNWIKDLYVDFEENLDSTMIKSIPMLISAKDPNRKVMINE